MRSSGVVVCLLLAALLPAQAPTGWVVIPLSDYDALRGANPPDETPAFDATLTRIDYDLRLLDGRATGKATLIVDVLRDTWVQVALPAGLLVRNVRLQPSGKAATLVDGALLFSKKGRYTLALELDAPVTVTSGEERLTLPASASGITRALLAISRPGLEMRATGGFVTPAGDNWQAYGRGNEALVLSWRRKLEENREVLPLRQRGTLTQWLGLGEDASSVWAEVKLDVQSGTARQVKLQVPPGVTVNQVPGANIADWDRTGDTLTVTFLEPVEKQTTFLVQAEAKLPRDGAFDLPMLRLLDVERESGGVSVEVLGAAEIRSRTAQGLERTEVTELGAFAAPRQSASVEAFRYLSGAPARALKVEVARYTPQAIITANVEEARIHALLGGDGKMLVRARYAVRNNQRNFLKLTLPTGATLWGARLEGRALTPGQAADGALMFPLVKTRGGEEAAAFLVEVSYLMKSTAWAERGRALLPLPALDLPVSRSGIVLFHPPRYKITVEPGAFRPSGFVKTESPAFDPPPAPAPTLPANLFEQRTNLAMQNSQILVDNFRARRDVATPPVVTAPTSFPALGPSLFLAAELTAEGSAAQVEVTFQKTRGEK